MIMYTQSPVHRKVESGQSTVMVALSFGVLLLFIIGVAILLIALLTTTTMGEYDEGNGLFETFEPQYANQNLTNDIDRAKPLPPDPNSLGEQLE